LKISEVLCWLYVKNTILKLVVLNITHFETLLEFPRGMSFLRKVKVGALSINPALSQRLKIHTVFTTAQNLGFENP
jgi:hypothetical protein